MIIMSELKTELVYGWMDMPGDILHEDCQKYGEHKRKLIVGTTHVVNNVPQNVVYGAAVRIINGTVVLDKQTRQDIVDKVHEWSETTGREYVMPDYYTIITGSLDWCDTSEYYL